MRKRIRFRLPKMVWSRLGHKMYLYEHQKVAVEKLRTGSILCGGVGTGKSRTALAYYFCKVCGGECDGVYEEMLDPVDLYIITTARKRDTLEWDEELVPFLLSRDKEKNHYDCNVIIDSWNNIKKYVGVKNAFFIFDEQRVVGSGAWVKSFLKITKENKWILLSATPGDSWIDYIPVFIANGFYKNRTQFIARHVVRNPHTQFFKVERYLEEGRLIKLRNYILVNMAYLKKTTPFHETVIAMYDKTSYKYVMKERWNIFKDRPIENVSELSYTIRKIVNSDSSRVEAVKKIMGKHKRIIIFYNYDYELELLQKMEVEDDVVIAEWNGHKHEPLPESEKWLYLVQYAAGSEGWNCIETNAIIFYSQNYSYKTMEQAAGRIDRINTKFKDLYYYHIRSNAPIDIGIYRALKRKQRFNEARFFQK